MIAGFVYHRPAEDTRGIAIVEKLTLSPGFGGLRELRGSTGGTMNTTARTARDLAILPPPAHFGPTQPSQIFRPPSLTWSFFSAAPGTCNFYI